jgi:hypothetical protein
MTNSLFLTLTFSLPIRWPPTSSFAADDSRRWRWRGDHRRRGDQRDKIVAVGKFEAADAPRIIGIVRT